ncbi:osm1 [Symbiodinium natans]|uniref:Osm1 protein n=1 Tax=Symbiodinium natans TaxID=878477 RepID=A0A812JSP3_9DINO|nr:osm1 [Symbiodinium natans]
MSSSCSRLNMLSGWLVAPVEAYQFATPIGWQLFAIKKKWQSVSGFPPALVEVAGHQRKRYRTVSILQPDPAPPTAATTTLQAAQTSRSGELTAGALVRILPDECSDFIPWSDMDANDCRKYAEPGWLLSCHDLRSVEERMGDLDERLDANLKLSPRDACCACGGSNATGRARAISRLASAVYDTLESIDNSQEVESQIPASTVASLRAVLDGTDGKELLESRLLPMTNEELAAAGRLAGDSSAHLYFRKPQELLPALELLVALFPSASAVEEEREAKNASPEDQRQLQDVEQRNMGDIHVGHAGLAMNAAVAVQLLSHVMRALSCLWRIYFIVLFVICATAVVWWVNVLRRPVTYVVLRSHEKFFGKQRQMEEPAILVNNRFNSQKLVGFFLPTERVSEFAAALGGALPQVTQV